MPILELPISVAGRRLRPVALGLTVWCVAVLWADHADGIDRSEWPVLAAVIVATVAFCGGWLRRSTVWEQTGLALVVFAAMSNALQVWFALGAQPRVLVSLAVAIIAAGSFFLERMDPITERVYGRPGRAGGK